VLFRSIMSAFELPKIGDKLYIKSNNSRDKNIITVTAESKEILYENPNRFELTKKPVEIVFEIQGTLDNINDIKKITGTHNVLRGLTNVYIYKNDDTRSDWYVVDEYTYNSVGGRKRKRTKKSKRNKRRKTNRRRR